MALKALYLVMGALGVFSFQQNDYKFDVERFELVWYNKTYIKDVKFVSYHPTRNQKRYNASATLLQDLGRDITETIQAYKYASNEYRLFPMTYSDNGCDTLDSDKFGINALSFDTNASKCPIKKGFYYIRNFYADDSKFPPFAPRGRFMLDLKMFYNKSILMGHGQLYFSIKPTNPLEKCIACNI